MIKCISIIILLSLSPLWGYPQVDSSAFSNFRFELGLGLGSAEGGGGLSGRLGLAYLEKGWGGTVRVSAHDGDEGKPRYGLFGMTTPRESFYDASVLLSKSLVANEYFQVLGSLGLGTVWGEKLNNERNGLVEFKNKGGIAYELEFATVASTIGISFSLIGNLNSESVLTAGLISISFGDQW